MRSRAGRTAACSVRREIVVNDAGYDTRVALLEDGKLVELMHERPDQRGMVGDIVLGKVEAVVPGLQAAFVDIASEKSAFLHASDLAEAEIEDDGHGDRRSRRYQPIQDVVSQGQDLLVQVTKEWLRPSAWVDQSGAPQASLDVDANRLVLLDRLESDDPENGEDIPF